MRHSQYLATEVNHDTEVQVMQISAPVFDSRGTVTASLMVLGSLRPLSGQEVEVLGERVVQAADRATTMARELRLGDPAAAL
jgi:DNA-binding IclR family transcriptional regulator